MPRGCLPTSSVRTTSAVAMSIWRHRLRGPVRGEEVLAVGRGDEDLRVRARLDLVGDLLRGEVDEHHRAAPEVRDEERLAVGRERALDDHARHVDLVEQREGVRVVDGDVPLVELTEVRDVELLAVVREDRALRHRAGVGDLLDLQPGRLGGRRGRRREHGGHAHQEKRLLHGRIGERCASDGQQSRQENRPSADQGSRFRYDSPSATW